MFNIFDAAKTVLNSVSSNNLFPWSFIDSNHGPFQLPSQMESQTRPLERKRKQEHIEPNLTKKMKPAPIIEEACPPALQLEPETVPSESPQISSYTCSHTPPASPLQSPIKSPKSPIQSPVGTPVKTPEKSDDPKNIIEEVILSSSASTPTSQTIIEEACPSPLKLVSETVSLKSPQIPSDTSHILSGSPFQSLLHSPIKSTKSPSLSPQPQSPSATSVKLLSESPEKLHQPTNVIGEVILLSPSSCSGSRSPSISPLPSQKKPIQQTTSEKQDLLPSQSNTTPQAIETKKLSPSKLSIVSLQNFNFFSNNLKLLNKLTNGDFNYNQFKDELKSPFHILMFYLLVEAKTSFNAASAINLFPWNFDVFHIGMDLHEPYQVFSSIHGNLPLLEKTAQSKVSNANVRKYVLYICVPCGAIYNEKRTISRHQGSSCRFKRKSKTPDYFDDDIKNRASKNVKEDNNAIGNEKDVLDFKTEEEVFKILIQTALNRAHEDGLLIQFDRIDNLLTTISTEFKEISFLVLISSIIMSQEGKYGLEQDELQCHDDNNKIWMDTERCFQIVELATKKAISVEVLESRLKQSVGKEGNKYVCKYPFCRCSGKFTRNSKAEIISHIEQSNYRLVCCGCHSSFKVISSLIRHSNVKCKHSKLLEKMKEATEKL